MKKIAKKLKEHLINYLKLKQRYEILNESEKRMIIKVLNEYSLNEQKGTDNLIKLSLKSLKEMSSIKFKSAVFRKFLKEELELPTTLKEELLQSFPYPKILNKLNIGDNKPLSDEEMKVLKIEAKSCSKIVNDMYRKGMNDPKKQPSEILNSIKRAFSLQDRNKKNKLYKEPRFIKPSDAEIEDTFTAEKELEEVIKETITSANIMPPTFKEEDKKAIVKTETKPVLKKKKKSKNLLTKKKI